MGDPNPQRTIGHHTWHDPYAGLEHTSSKEFEKAVKEETERWNSALISKNTQKAVQSWENDFVRLYTSALPKSPTFAHESFQWNGLTIRVQNGFGHKIHVWFLQGEKILQTHTDLTGFETDPESNMFLTIRDIGKGAETLEVSVYTYPFKQPMWSHSPVGPNAYFNKTKVLYQTVENHLRYPGIVSVAKETGENPHTIFVESDKRYQVELIKCGPELFFKRMNALHQQIGHIVGNTGTIQWITKEVKSFLVPISKYIYGTNTHLVIDGHKYALPKDEYILAASASASMTDQTILVTTTKRAYTSLYTFDIPTKSFTKLFNPDCPNEITIHTYSANATLHFPHKPSCIWMNKPCVFQFPEPTHLPYFHHGQAQSKDGTHIPFTIVSKVKKPIALIVSAYGAYGISSSRSYPIRWLPYLERGYAFAVVSPRGGREDGDAWYDGGRTASRKQNTFDDTASAIKTIQQILHLYKQHTIFYGRSAGGLLAANIAQQYPELVRAVYAEVPYVDVLRTTSNPNLPLTQLEYDEFGNPARKSEFNAIKAYSPIDNVEEAPLHAPMILAKTALHDVQVLPYEALKWAKKLRAHNWNVYVNIDGDGGHFVAEKKMYRDLAEDAVILSLPRHKGKGKDITRRRRSSRKHFTRHSTSPPAV